MKIKCILALFGFLFISTAVAANQPPSTIWVASDNAKLKADWKSSSATLAEVSKGTVLSVLAYQEKWYQVKLPNGKTGWIYRGKVSETEVQKTQGKEEGGSVGGLLGDLSGSNIRADNTDSSRSIRGLSPEATEYAKQNGTPQVYRNELDKVIDRKVSPTEIDQFLKQGKIGEYQE
ncbi:MAG: SH3 domain-containing protein [Desulfobacterium sp.]|nr:SH3 domain-containing protein [Desulfobacterium sp.]